jgi:hypothetical protein
VQRRYRIANGELNKRQTQRQAEFDEANALIAGTNRESAGLMLLSRYPTEANVILSELLQVIPDDIQSANNLLQLYAEE